MRSLALPSRVIDYDSPAFIIAEIGINHNGDPALAREMVDAAGKAGADAVKFQVFSVDRFICREGVSGVYTHQPSGKSISFYELFKQVELQAEHLADLLAYCRKKKVLFFATPFDGESLSLLDSLGTPFFKVASCDLNHLPFLADIASRKKPMILSTGMATMPEVEKALTVIRESGDPDVAVLHCVSSYPPKMEDLNLRAIRTLAERFPVPVGYSDHSIGVHIPVAAVAMGAKIIEKHFTLDKKLFGPDHPLSADPGEFKEMVNWIRDVEKAGGSGIKEPSPEELGARQLFRRSIVAKTDIPEGTVLSEDLLAFKRPGKGMPPGEIGKILGRRTRIRMEQDQMIRMEDLKS